MTTRRPKEEDESFEHKTDRALWQIEIDERKDKIRQEQNNNANNQHYRKLNGRDEYGFAQCLDDNDTDPHPPRGRDNPIRLLKRHGILDDIPAYLCPKDLDNSSSESSDERPRNKAKNVILVIGDGMGWEMVRAGAIAKQVIQELETTFNCNIQTGCLGNAAARQAFETRRLGDYYTEGVGSGLSWQDLEGFHVMTTSPVILQKPEAGNRFAPDRSMLDGRAYYHGKGLEEEFETDCGYPIDFSPLDYESQGGNMVLWDDAKGGQFPWDPRYKQIYDPNDTFDPTFIMQHAPDCHDTATAMSTGYKTARSMLAVNLYEEDVPTLIESAQHCGKAGGFVTSVPILHPTGAAFMSHSNYYRDKFILQAGFEAVSPSFAAGVCVSSYYPTNRWSDMADSDKWSILYPQSGTAADDMYTPISDKDPDHGDHVLACMGGDGTSSGEYNLPMRGIDGDYRKRWCSDGDVIGDKSSSSDTPDYIPPVEIQPESFLCNHYSDDDMDELLATTPHISKNVDEALEFLSKADQGFFMVYEQGDINWASDANHMDDLLGMMLDMDKSVQVIRDWIDANGGWNDNALYVTADHDGYLTLEDDFPMRLANKIIEGRSFDMTPQSNSGHDPWVYAVKADRELKDDKNQTEDIKDFSTWSCREQEQVGHFWGPKGAGGNGWGAATTRPVPVSFQGDGGCLDQFVGKSYQVLGREVVGSPGKIDQVHLHACMLKTLFGL